MKNVMRMCLIALLLAVSVAHAGLPERPMLVGGSARLIGMGSAATAGPTDATVPFWNPALLGSVRQSELGFADVPLQHDAADREGFLAALLDLESIFPALESGAVGMAAWFDGWGEDEEKNRIIRTGLGLSAGGGFSLGANLLHERRNTRRGTDVGWGLDLGILWQRNLHRYGEQLRLGMAAQRLVGHREWLNGAPFSTPLRLRWGLGYQPDPDTWLVSDLVYTQDMKLTSSERLRLHLGVERWFFDRIALRMGYTTIAHYDRLTDGEWARGFGVRGGGAELAYAYVSGGELREATHWISASVRWDWRQAEPPLQVAEPVPSLKTEPPVKASLAAIPEVFSPNGDGQQDVVQFEAKLSPEQPWFIEIIDAQGNSVRQVSSISPHWNGLDPAGRLVPDGIYQAALFPAAGAADPLATAPLHVDVSPPLLHVTTEPLVLMSQQQGEGTVIELPKVHMQVQDDSDLRRWSLSITDAQGTVLAEFGDDGTPPPVLLWEDAPSQLMGGAESQGIQCLLQAEDNAGNAASEMADLAVVDLAQIGSRREKRGLVMTLPGVAFDTNSAEILPEFYEALSEAASAIKAYPDAKVRIEGHTDGRGAEGYNMNLSLARANAVMEYLSRTFDLPASRFSTVGYGESRPIADNETEEGRQRNRRVEIVLLVGADAEALDTSPVTTGEPTLSESPAEPVYTVSVGSFRSRENAEALLETIQQLDLPHEIRLLKVLMGDETLYRVTVGAFTEEAPATGLAELLEREHGLLPVVMPYE